jgi:WXG100 family type VII secretion target
MSAAKVRADYEELAHIARVFGTAAEVIHQTLTRLQRQKERLQSGDWIGSSADRFYQVLDSTVLPAMQCLAQGLESAGRTTAQIRP